MKIKKREPRLRPEEFSQLLEAADLVGDFIQYWGFKKVQGRIWACLFLMNEPLNTRQLVELLGISNSLVSISVAELLRYRVILEVEKGRNGVLLYRANPEVGAVIAGVLRSREQKLLKRIQESSSKLHPSAKAALRMSEENIKKLQGWVQLAESLLETGIGFVEASL